MEDPADCKQHAAMLYLPFEGKDYSLLTFLVTMYTLTTALWWRMRSYLIRTGIEQRSASLMLAAMYALSYPLWFELSRAHVAIGVFLLLAAGVWACLRGSLYCLAVLLGPESELVWHDVLYAAQIKCVALVLLLVFAMVTPWNGLEDIWAVADCVAEPPPPEEGPLPRAPETTAG